MSEGLFSQLRNAELERLAILAEEMAEATQVIGKIIRHGYSSCHPDDPHDTQNRYLLEKELGHVLRAIKMMKEAGDVDDYRLSAASEAKKMSMKPYLHHQ